MTYFFDHNLSWKLAAILQLLGVDARALKDEFPVNTPDVDWLPVVGERGWIVLTEDDAMHTRPAERAALKKHQVMALFLPKNFPDRNAWQQALWIVKHWPKVEQQAKQLRSGTCVRLTHNAKFLYFDA